jgi:hypothetical protein
MHGSHTFQQRSQQTVFQCQKDVTVPCVRYSPTTRRRMVTITSSFARRTLLSWKDRQTDSPWRAPKRQNFLQRLLQGVPRDLPILVEGHIWEVGHCLKVCSGRRECFFWLRGSYLTETDLSLCSSRYWAAKAPPFKVELKLNPSRSKAATDTGSSRNATTPRFWRSVRSAVHDSGSFCTRSRPSSTLRA